MSARIRKAAKAPAGTRITAASRARGLWVEVEPGFHVGNDGQQYLGSITGNIVEGFTAFGPTSEVIGRFEQLDEAKAAVALVAGAPAADTEPLLS
ncbi:hypothetical protein [Microbacterium hydrocarbonoxydans]|uniref:Uncharacterized protein n=1 Tax=Microbacterium hydrocarbonoxydans TaxID=273678 RepID=A0A1H4IQP3_9MICO|nr:hypothetical protein [Microbacterium hydrocarbonoxydans]SEB35608.1 hypothetical protein SAMN04489807_0081 [Microbacterium hydrocarbonoxydans]